MIVAGIDFSRGSLAALRLAVAWAARMQGPLHAIHALEPPADAVDEAGRARLAHEIEALFAPAGAGEISPPPTVAVMAARAVDALAPAPDRLVVVGAEGGSATLLRRTGRVPATLAARLPAGARVLVAPPGWAHAPSRRRRATSERPRTRAVPERVLVACALDGRDADRLATAVRAMGASPTSELHLAHVVDVSSARHHPVAVRDDSRAATEGAVRAAREALLDLSSEAPIDLVARRDVRLHVVRQGPVERDLAGLASSQAIDLVVAGAGSVASRLVGFVTCPLLVTGS